MQISIESGELINEAKADIREFGELLENEAITKMKLQNVLEVLIKQNEI